MTKLTRFGVSLDQTLLDEFDTYCKDQCYNNRSEALRDLIRAALIQKKCENSQGEVAGTLTIMYNHHESSLAKKITSIQHDIHHIVSSTLHVHLDHDNCLEVLVLKGNADIIKKVSAQIISTKGVKHGQLILTSSDS